MAVVEISRIQVRRGLENQTGVPVLDSGEFGWASDTENLYIGLRRVDGGSRDANVRVLTENDLPNFFQNDPAQLLTQTYTYDQGSNITRYQWQPLPAPASEVVRYLQDKLDDFVSVKDFGAAGDGSDATDAIERALFWTNSSTYSASTFTEKILYFPAGEYRITKALPLYRRTRIVGEGIENTIISTIDSGYHFFETRDNANNSLDNGPSVMDTVEYVSVKNLTLLRKNTSTLGTSFLTLDNASFVEVRNVRFASSATISNIHLSTSTFVGINIRNTTSNYASAQRINIDDCHFYQVGTGIASDHNISDVSINNCSFEYSNYGVRFNFSSTGTNLGPRSVKITNNDFNMLYNRGIYAEKSTNADQSYYAHIVSQNNRFNNVANTNPSNYTDLGVSGVFGVATGTSVIWFNSKGNVSQNDFFNRLIERTQNANTATFFPLVDGIGTFEQTIPFTDSVSSPATKTAFYIPMTTRAIQNVNVRYSVYTTDNPPKIDRQGTLKINIGPDQSLNDVSIYDDYSYQFNGDFPAPSTIDETSWRYETLPTYRAIRFYIYNPTPIGDGAQFNVTNSPYPTYTGVQTTGTYTVVIAPSSSGGANYQIGDIIRISATSYNVNPTNLSSTSTGIADPGGANDIFITVQAGNLSGGQLQPGAYVSTGTGVQTIATATVTNAVGTVVFRTGDPGFGYGTVYYNIQQQVVLG